MQFTTTVFALVSALAASASAQQYPPTNGTIPAVPAGPTGTGSAGGAGGYPGNGGSGNGSTTLTTPSNPGPTGFEAPSQYGNGAVGRFAGSGLGLLVAGGVAFAL